MRYFTIIVLCLTTLCCTSQEQQATKHIFYLHGRIIELQGVDAVSDTFGRYEYHAILIALAAEGAAVHHEVRTATTGFEEFCFHISAQIDTLISEGVKPQDISVVGASKGAVMAMQISSNNDHAINYILLAANNDQIERENDWRLHGRILGIYEQSDKLAGKNYDYWVARSTDAVQFKQLKIQTGLGHGFLYRPLMDWVRPTQEWIQKSGE